MKILIDGYNLIFECGLHGKKVNPRSLARARELLLRNIGNSYPDLKSGDITVVFDAGQRSSSGQQDREVCGLIEVLYSIHFDDADAMIESLIQKHSSPKQLLVVSSDHRLHKAASRRKAAVTDSGPWYDTMLTRKDSEPSPDPVGDAKPQIETLLSDEELSMFKDDLRRDSL